jgi:hypothetical protein
VPILWNPTCASGFNRHRKSSLPAGARNIAIVTAQAVAPNTKKATSTLIPNDKRRGMARFYD